MSRPQALGFAAAVLCAGCSPGTPGGTDTGGGEASAGRGASGTGAANSGSGTASSTTGTGGATAATTGSEASTGGHGTSTAAAGTGTAAGGSSGAGSAGGVASGTASAGRGSSGAGSAGEGSSGTGAASGSSGGSSSAGEVSSGTSSGGPADAGASLAPGAVWWLMDDGEIGNITGSGPDGSYLAKAYFDHPTTYIWGALTYSGATHTMDFKAASAAGSCGQTLVGTVDPTNCASLAGYGAVLLDIEGGKTWCSAASEKQEPIAACQAAYAQVQSFNQSCRSDAGRSPLLLIATPGTDLTSTFGGDGGCGGASDAYHQYICLGIAGGVAAAADVYEVQAQSIENDQSEFLWFVQAAAQQARAATNDPAYPVLAGITADPSRLPSCAAGVLYADVSETIGTVEGYWLNVFGAACGTSTDGQVAAELLAMMADGGP
ncbi:MAG TPA: hypothetical protein VMB50_19860 [Myxococcales bacterium]|nr:hypothetical protein [Myxococcales bacterium]